MFARDGNYGSTASTPTSLDDDSSVRAASTSFSVCSDTEDKLSSSLWQTPAPWNHGGTGASVSLASNQIWQYPARASSSNLSASDVDRHSTQPGIEPWFDPGSQAGSQTPPIAAVVAAAAVYQEATLQRQTSCSPFVFTDSETCNNHRHEWHEPGQEALADSGDNSSIWTDSQKTKDCSSCGGSTTPLWRSDGSLHLLCNSCGLYHRLSGLTTPGSTSEVKVRCKAPHTHHLGIVCTNCQTSITTLWRRSVLGLPVCNACGLYFKLHGYNRPLTMRKDALPTRKRKVKSTCKKRKSRSKKTHPSAETHASPMTTPTPEASVQNPVPHYGCSLEPAFFYNHQHPQQKFINPTTAPFQAPVVNRLSHDLHQEPHDVSAQTNNSESFLSNYYQTSQDASVNRHGSSLTYPYPLPRDAPAHTRTSESYLTNNYPLPHDAPANRHTPESSLPNYYQVPHDAPTHTHSPASCLPNHYQVPHEAPANRHTPEVSSTQPTSNFPTLHSCTEESSGSCLTAHSEHFLAANFGPLYSDVCMNLVTSTVLDLTGQPQVCHF